MMNRKITLFSIFLIITAIILGAFGAHGLKSLISAEKLVSFETGVKYQMYQGLGFLILGLNATKIKIGKFFYYSGIIGTLLFSFSIYFLSLSDFISLPKMIFVPLTPLGGMLMIVSWTFLFVSIFNERKNK